jgi:hypothetical protein
MSSNIWMLCEGASRLRALRLEAWRVVEAQHEVSTRKLVSSVAEQELLEEMVERVKPPAVSAGRRGLQLHYLLTTPFRYPPLKQGSRFGTRAERGIWYGAEELRTALAEVAHYRMRFIQSSHAELGVVSSALTAFTISMRTVKRGMDLVSPPFDAFRGDIAHPDSYAATQPLGRAMRDAGVELWRWPSARDADGGVCVGAFTPAVFGALKPKLFETWYCSADRSRVDFVRGGFGERRVWVFGNANNDG